jgi:hypothetical protein
MLSSRVHQSSFVGGFVGFPREERIDSENGLASGILLVSLSLAPLASPVLQVKQAYTGKAGS